ncbi:MAG: S8 family serine peptidase [Acidimicrobiales bacterium]
MKHWRKPPSYRDSQSPRSARRRATAAVAGLAAVLVAGLPLAASAVGSAPNDPFFPQQWNMTQVGAPAAWTRSTGAGVIIGVVDTGVDLTHQDLAGKIVATTDCVGSGGTESACSGSGQDDNGHGTHVSGIAAADTNNGLGVAGMAPAAKLVVAKALDSSGSGNFNDVNAGIEWVVDHGARVVNLSLGSDLPGLGGLVGGSLTSGVDYAWSHGAIPVIAAGNQNFFGLGSSNYGNVNAVIVGATGPKKEVAPYSSPLGNAKWALVAPGGDGTDAEGNPVCTGTAQAACIVSTYWSSSNATSEYAYDQGTSMATPMVSGALALLLAMGMTPTQAVNRMLSTADKSVSCGSDCAGLLDAAAAVGATAAGGPPATTVTSAAHPGPAPAGTTATTGPSSSPDLVPGTGLPTQTAPSVPKPPVTSTIAPGPAVPLEQAGRSPAVAAPGPVAADHQRNSSATYTIGGLAALLLLGLVGALDHQRRSGIRAGAGR